MSDDYLWDKSGEPDPEVEQLEQLLGNLRYRRKPGPLPLPQRAPIRPRRFDSPTLAAVAAVLLMMVAAGVWYVSGGGNQSQSSGVSAINVQTGRAQDWLSAESVIATNAQPKDVEIDKPERALVATKATRVNTTRRLIEFKRNEPSEGRIANVSSPNRAEQISEDEGVAAREKLIRALHLASSKLNLVQKKVQDNKVLGPVS